jgi:hypothetical protein
MNAHLPSHMQMTDDLLQDDLNSNAYNAFTDDSLQLSYDGNLFDWKSKITYPIIPSPPFKNRISPTERNTLTCYENCLMPILEDDLFSFDFPLTFNIRISQNGRQHIINFNDPHKFIDLYNHSEFIRIHLHNMWLLDHDNFNIDLPEDIFPTPDHVYIFCGSAHLYAISTTKDVTSINLMTLLDAAFFLQLKDYQILDLLSKFPLKRYTENKSFCRAFYILLNNKKTYPNTLLWFIEKLPSYNEAYFLEKAHKLEYAKFAKCVYNYYRSIDRYQKSYKFYNTLVGRSYCKKACKLCNYHYWATAHSQRFLPHPAKTANPKLLPPTPFSVETIYFRHKCSITCVNTDALGRLNQRHNTSIYKISHLHCISFIEYHCLDRLGKIQSQNANQRRNLLLILAYKHLLKRFRGIFTAEYIIEHVIPYLNYSNIRMVACQILPVNIPVRPRYPLDSQRNLLLTFFPPESDEDKQELIELKYPNNMTDKQINHNFRLPYSI